MQVGNGNEVIPVINSLRNKDTNPNWDLFETVMVAQDWHCADHISFASQHPNHTVFSKTTLEYTKNGELCRRPGTNWPSEWSRDCEQVS